MLSFSKFPLLSLSPLTWLEVGTRAPLGALNCAFLNPSRTPRCVLGSPPGPFQLGERFRCTQTVPLPNWPGHLDALTIWRQVAATVDCQAPGDSAEASYCRLAPLRPSTDDDERWVGGSDGGSGSGSQHGVAGHCHSTQSQHIITAHSHPPLVPKTKKRRKDDSPQEDRQTTNGTPRC